MARLVYAEEFSSDLEREITYLHRIHELGWIRTLKEDLTEMESLLEHFPRA